MSSRQLERKMLTFHSNQPGLQEEEAMVFGEMTNCDETNLLAQDLKNKRSSKGNLLSPDTSQDIKP